MKNEIGSVKIFHQLMSMKIKCLLQLYPKVVISERSCHLNPGKLDISDYQINPIVKTFLPCLLWELSKVYIKLGILLSWYKFAIISQWSFDGQLSLMILMAVPAEQCFIQVRGGILFVILSISSLLMFFLRSLIPILRVE